jgi:hypothetical protein
VADFTVIVSSGATAEPWIEQDAAGDPSRLAQRPGNPERRWLAERGSVVELRAQVEGVTAPLDSALVGRLFTADLVEGNSYPTFLASPVGQSSVVRVRFPWCGHFAIAIRREDGGAEIVPIDVRAPE